jgi:hypothetical protein
VGSGALVWAEISVGHTALVGIRWKIAPRTFLEHQRHFHVPTISHGAIRNRRQLIAKIQETVGDADRGTWKTSKMRRKYLI